MNPHRSVSLLRTCRRTLAAFAFFLTTGPLLAQGGTAIEALPGGVVQARAVAPAGNPDIPQPPKSVLPEVPKHALGPVPAGPDRGMPQPGDAATSPRTAAPGVVTAPEDFKLYMNRPVTPAGASTARIGEPSVAIHRDTAFQTGNWYAARSEDSGMTWSYVNPTTTFPASDSGFCCDQRTLYIPSRDMTVWLLQYGYNGSTQTNRHRIAVARGRDALRAGAWIYADWTPASFSLGTGRWLDFPDLAYADDHLYLACNVYSAAGAFVSALVYRIDLTAMATSLNWPFFFQTQVGLGGLGAYRYTQGATSHMYFACHRDTSTLRVFSWPDNSNTITSFDRGVASWSDSARISLGPDGRNWAGRSDSRVLGGYVTSLEMGFLWGCAQNPPFRLQPFTRVARFLRAGLLPVGENDIWSNTRAFLYPCVTTNAAGHKGGTIAFGGTDLHPSLAAFMVDSDSTVWAPLDSMAVRVGTHGPSNNSWGDYFSVQRHPIVQATWVGCGMTQQGGPDDNDSEPRFVWFGRERYEPNWLDLDVIATGLPGNAVPITVTETDRLGQKNGTTPFTRSFAPQQGYRLAAPATVTVSGRVFAFLRWVVAGQLQAIGQTELVVANIGTTDETVEVRYLERFTLTVTSAPMGSVPIQVSAMDLNRDGDGTTTFTRRYRDGTQTVLTAPATVGTNPFKHWTLTGVRDPVTTPALTVDMTRDRTANAVYWNHTPGLFVPFGTACAGSNGTPALSGIGSAETGSASRFRLASGPRGSVVILVMGLSNQGWNNIPLPLSLAGAGAPGCTMLAGPDLTFTTTTDPNTGLALLQVPIPADQNLIGGRLFTQYWCVDPPANNLGLTFSNGLEVRIGGLQ